MATYPLIIRNPVPLMLRIFMAAWLGGLALITYAALRDGPPEPHKCWPFALIAFWAIGLFGFVHSLRQDTSRIAVPAPGKVQISRGPAFRRRQGWTDRLSCWIDEDVDSDGAPYFKLLIDAPDGKLVVREGHNRARLEMLKQRLEKAVSGD